MFRPFCPRWPPALLGAALAAPAAAAYPEKPIKLIVPFAPGGGNDAIARTIGRRIGEALGQPVVIENRAGAGGRLGVDAGVNAEPDGYTLTLISNSYAVNPSLYTIKFDPIKDITPIGMIAQGPLLIAVPASLPVKNLSELIALAKSRKGDMTYASSGQGGISHLATELFLKDAGIEMTHVPYRGTAPALTDTVAGQTNVFFSTAGAAFPYMKNGRLKVLAQTLPKRLVAEPSIPTVNEAGLPGYEVVIWYGLVAPKGLPPAIQQRLNKEMNAALAQPELIEQLKNNGEEPTPGKPEQLASQIAKELAVWKRVVAEAGIRAE
ncbi:Tripartite tricarboxylate transporter family receptor [Pigmentiphaga humi]|uniref:Tripartite tricarboxylate transporter family receptor n=1 Tax=Pigmentiphaga humi TaxID=2478468 RepID=A0A3P4B412_9BURK|nr:tripartite tricarboxylate transporter substrate binding protein [Pigmentiphaga humi]VCU71034.1 Tripartite tricarboxylate transporter family receptor [Pigmentiphaga humi]